MTAFVNDTFTDTNGDELTTQHTGELGATWSTLRGTGQLLIQANRLTCNHSASWTAAKASGTPPSADYYCEAQVYVASVAQYAEIGVRAVNDSNRYRLWFTNTGMTVVRTDGGSDTVLGSNISYTWTVGNTYTVRLTVSGTGSTVTLTVHVNGVQQYTFNDTAAGRITSAGGISVGIRDGTSSTGFQFDSITGDDGAVADSITINAPVALRGYSRSGTTGTIGGISLTLVGATDDIEGSFNGGAYVTVGTALAAGTHTGLSMTGQAQGQGTLTFRKKNNTAITATVNNITISDAFLVVGDSRNEGRLTNAQTHGHATLKPTVFRQDDAWAEANDPFDTGATTGHYLVKFAREFMESTGLPPIFVSCGTGSTDLIGTANQWVKGQSGYTEMMAQVSASGIASFKGVLALFGPNAVVQASTPSQAAYNAALDAFAADVAADVPGAPPVFVDVCGETGTGSPPDRTAALNNVRAAVLEAVGDNSAIKLGPVLVDQNYADNVHFQTDADGLAVARRLWLQVGDAFYGTNYGRGPRIQSAQLNVARNQVTVVFSRNLKTGLTHSTAPWRYVDATPTIAVTGVSYHGTNPAALVLTLASAATGAAGSGRLTFGYGDTAVGQVVPMSADITVPTGATIQIPAEPAYSVTVAEATVATATVTLTTDGTTPASSLTGLKWAWFDQLTPDLMAAPTDKGAAETTDGSGVLTVSLPNSTKTSGQVGWLIVTNSDGTTTQSPPHKAFSGPVVVA